MDATTGVTIRAHLNRALGRSYMLMYGLLLAVMNGQEWLSAHAPGSPLLKILFFGDLVFLIWMPVAWWASGESGDEPGLSKEDKLTGLLAICVALVVWFVKIPLSTGLLGFLFGLGFLVVGWIRRRRYYGAAIGWLLGGLAISVLFRGATQGDQTNLLLTAGGIATALQGAWEMASSNS